MDYLNGVPMGYPEWTTLKFVANMNLTMLEPGQKMRLTSNQNYGSIAMYSVVTDLIPDWTFVIKHWKTRQADREAEV